MFQKVLEYAGEYRKTTYLSMAVMLIGIVMNVLPFLFIYQLIRPLLLGESLELGYAAWRVAAIAVCGVLYAVLYVKGLSLSHRAAYNTLKNLRASLQGKLERQPLGVIQEKGVGALKKMFIDDIDSIELLLAHALPEGLANLAVPAFVFLAMFFVDWKLALLSLCALPLGLVQGLLALDGPLQQHPALCGPVHSACRGVPGPAGIFHPAGFRPGAVHVLRRGCAPAAGAGVYVHPAPDQLQDHCAGAADGRTGSGADRGRLLW